MGQRASSHNQAVVEVDNPLRPLYGTASDPFRTQNRPSPRTALILPVCYSFFSSASVAS